ncbi:DUF2612 domain-containing protein [Jinshanibacter sp. LJY008]|uniref:DUF2612 domain-containing protein n=1 Tax=Limnobaculum eriocheiris TaxID=2897391 RepID=A0A9X1MV79_9GAMM|nr:DUF2612 domain-containing protein [Limnobaculum eriocheiris]MCD1124800.1 DUF2612 domain-containing protein [Limnobaculum eriocheiris]
MRIQEFDFSVDLMRVLLWEYNDAENLQALLQKKQNWYNGNQTTFWNDWYTNVFNLNTANAFGLSVWAIILNIPLSVTPSDQPSQHIFGLGQYNENFNNGTFQSIDSEQITLSEEQTRLLLKLRYYQLTSRGTIPEMNHIIADIFGDTGGGYASDSYDMNLVTIFLNSTISQQYRFVLEKFDIFPRPAGVGIQFKRAITGNVWGLGSERENFGHGNLYRGND